MTAGDARTVGGDSDGEGQRGRNGQEDGGELGTGHGLTVEAGTDIRIGPKCGPNRLVPWAVFF